MYTSALILLILTSNRKKYRKTNPLYCVLTFKLYCFDVNTNYCRNNPKLLGISIS